MKQLVITDNHDGTYLVQQSENGKPAADGMKFTKKVYLQAWLEHEKQTGEPFSVRNVSSSDTK